MSRFMGGGGIPADTNPPQPDNGKQWVDTSQSPPEVKIYDSATQAWLPADTKATVVSQTEPTPEVGKIWFEPASGGTNMYAASSKRWVFLKFLADIPDSGVARWRLDDSDTVGSTAVDVWNDNDGTINGATTGVSGANQTYTTNEAYDFDGSDDNVSLPDLGSSVSGSSERTIAYWVYHKDGNGGPGVAYGDESAKRHKFTSNTSPASDEITLRADFLDMAWSVTINKKTWHHIVWTYDGGNVGDLSTEGDGLSVYVDGNHISNGSFINGSSSDSLSTANTNYRIAYNVPDNSYLPGTVDDVRFYGKQLSSTEVSDLYQTGSIV